MKNRGVTIYQNCSFQSNFDLKDILNVIGQEGKECFWKASNVECLGASAQTLHQISDNQQVIEGNDFYRIVENTHQVLDGYFVAFKGNQKTRWLQIRSIRGDEFDIETEDNLVIKKIRESFKEVKDLIY